MFNGMLGFLGFLAAADMWRRISNVGTTGWQCVCDDCNHTIWQDECPDDVCPRCGSEQMKKSGGRPSEGKAKQPQRGGQSGRHEHEEHGRDSEPMFGGFFDND